MRAVHAGAGEHDGGRKEEILSLCSRALRSSCPCCCVQMIKVMESHELTNCGRGSNLTRSGTVEMEAALMRSPGLAFGAVGVLKRVEHPVELAEAVLVMGERNSSEHVISPMVLVGEGAERLAERVGLRLVDDVDKELITDTARSHFHRAIGMMDMEQGALDTVGAVSIQENGDAEAGVSSGGLLLKIPGRLGHCTGFGAGVWAERRSSRSVAISTSGCGEYLVRTGLAMNMAQSLLDSDLTVETPVEIVRDVFMKGFIQSPMLQSTSMGRRLAGVIILLRDPDLGLAEFIFCHNTRHFATAYMVGGKAKKVFSELFPNQVLLVQSFSCKS